MTYSSGGSDMDSGGKMICHPQRAFLGRCDRNFSKVATARGFARGLLALAKCSARCDRNP